MTFFIIHFQNFSNKALLFNSSFPPKVKFLSIQSGEEMSLVLKNECIYGLCLLSSQEIADKSYIKRSLFTVLIFILCNIFTMFLC